MRHISMLLVLVLAGCGGVAGGLTVPPVDAGSLPAGSDAGAQVDAGPGDAGAQDAGPGDAGASDAGAADAGPVDAGSGEADAGQSWWRPRPDAGFPPLPLAGCRPLVTGFAQPELDAPAPIQGVATLRMAPDGTPNLAVVTSQGLYLARRAPDGGFDVDASPRVPVAGGAPTVGDWNGDGLPDLAYCASGGGLVLAFGTGDAGLEAEQIPDAGTCTVVTLADEPEGKDEVGTFGYQSLTVWRVLSNGAATPLATRPLQKLTAGYDVDGDGRGDLLGLTPLGDGGTLLVEELSGAQPFDHAREVPLPGSLGYPDGGGLIHYVAIADVNGDGFPDAVGQSNQAPTVAFLYPDGGADLACSDQFDAGTILPVFPDLDGQGGAEVLTFTSPGVGYGALESFGLRAFYPLADGGLVAGPASQFGYHPNTSQSAQVVPVRLHGDDDLLFIGIGEAQAHLAVNEGDGRLFVPEFTDTPMVRSPRVPSPPGVPTYVDGVGNRTNPGVADLNGDGLPDGDTGAGTFMNQGDWLRLSGDGLTYTSANPAYLLADVDGDGRDELVQPGQVTHYFDDGGSWTSGFVAFRTVNVGSMIAGRFSGPDTLQFVSANAPDGDLQLWSFLPDAGAEDAGLLAADAGLAAVASADFDGDGVPDVVAVGADVRVYVGGDGGLRQVFQDALPTGTTSDWCAVGDFDGDGNQDFELSLYAHGNSSMVYFGLGDGGFVGADLPGVGGNAVLAGDLYGDGREVLVTPGLQLWSWADGGFTSQSPVGWLSWNLRIARTADFDGDGRVDILSETWLIRNACRDIGR